MENVARINKTGRHETLVAVAVSQHPEPIRIVAIQHRYEFASLDTDVVLISRYKCVKDDVSSGRRILWEFIKNRGAKFCYIVFSWYCF